MSTLILDITYFHISKVIMSNIYFIENHFMNRHKETTHIGRYTSSVIVVIPVECAYSIKLLDTQDLNQINIDFVLDFLKGSKDSEI